MSVNEASVQSALSKLIDPNTGKDLSKAFLSLRLAGESVSDSEKFNRLREFPFFTDFNDVALWEVVRIGSWKQVKAGTAVIREGEAGDRAGVATVLSSV